MIIPPAYAATADVLDRSTILKNFLREKVRRDGDQDPGKQVEREEAVTHLPAAAGCAATVINLQSYLFPFCIQHARVLEAAEAT
jgi:hypothetical protein